MIFPSFKASVKHSTYPFTHTLLFSSLPLRCLPFITEAETMLISDFLRFQHLFAGNAFMILKSCTCISLCWCLCTSLQQPKRARICIKEQHKNSNIKINDGNYAIERKSIDIKLCDETKAWHSSNQKYDGCKQFGWFVEKNFASFALICIVDNCFFCVLEVHYANMRANELSAECILLIIIIRAKSFCCTNNSPQTVGQERGREQKKTSFFFVFSSRTKRFILYICKTNKC